MQTTRECKLLDLREHDGRFYFHFGSGDDFTEKLQAFKRAFHYRERAWNGERKEWSVPATEESEAKLAAIFSPMPPNASPSSGPSCPCFETKEV